MWVSMHLERVVYINCKIHVLNEQAKNRYLIFKLEKYLIDTNNLFECCKTQISKDWSIPRFASNMLSFIIWDAYQYCDSRNLDFTFTML